MTRAQSEDPELWSWLEEGSQAPDLVSFLYENEAVKTYWHHKDQLHLHGVIYDRSSDGVEQLAVPKILSDKFLRLAHTGITGRHLGVRRTW